MLKVVLVGPPGRIRFPIGSKTRVDPVEPAVPLSERFCQSYPETTAPLHAGVVSA
jgi:hypothetical protein